MFSLLTLVDHTLHEALAHIALLIIYTLPVVLCVAWGLADTVQLGATIVN